MAMLVGLARYSFPRCPALGFLVLALKLTRSPRAVPGGRFSTTAVIHFCAKAITSLRRAAFVPAALTLPRKAKSSLPSTSSIDEKRPDRFLESLWHFALY